VKGHSSQVARQLSTTVRIRRWKSGSQYQEAYCRHRMIADIYAHAERVGADVQVLSHDVDASGVDLTLVSGSDVIPIQLKSVVVGSATSRWKVKRRIPFPVTDSPLSKGIMRWDGPATEGYGGALVVQRLLLTDREPWEEMWYGLGTLPLLFLREPARARAIVRTAANCPKNIQFVKGDLTPPLRIGELLWLLTGYDSGSEILNFPSPVDVLLSGAGGWNAKEASRTLREIESLAESRWRKRMKEVSRG
jgi:hypothetical protein